MSEVIRTRVAALQYLELCEQGKAKVVKTKTSSGSELQIVSTSGVPQGVVAPKWHYMFEQFYEANDGGDGLFPGLHQTAVKE
jgi:hypothetical protein